MAAAPVGDDQFGEDPTTNALQARVASLFGKEAALWLPSGTMANQVALQILTHRGDDVIVGRATHAVWSEAGASAANAGVQFTEVGTGGTFTADDFVEAIKPRDHMIMPGTALVEIENTHNRGGGLVWDQSTVIGICDAARGRGINTFLDGARIWNAAAASGVGLAELAQPFDVVSVALSKGLGAPAGSMLAGPAALMARAVRVRRMLGGAMRQNGILAAAGLYALDHHLARLPEDHANARRIAARLHGLRGVVLDLATVQTNIVIFHLGPGLPAADAIVARARERGVLVIAFGPRTVRAVTHYDVSTAECEQAADILAQVLEAA